MEFPYKPRLYQLETLRRIRSGLKNRYICLNAATGFGKTPVILSALLPLIDRGYIILWAVRTGNETDRPIEELKVINERTRSRVFGLSYRGKRDMCLLAKEKFPEGVEHSEVSYLCKRMMKKCPYYNKYLANFRSMLPLYISKSPLTYTEIFDLSRRLGICPYYAQRGLLRFADVIALSYNYIINPFYEWSIKSIIPFNKAILVIDEAHNLQNIEINSDHITLGTVNRSKLEAKEYGRKDLLRSLEYIEERMLEIYKSLRKDEDKEYDPETLLPESSDIFLDELLSLGEYVRRRKLEEGKRPRSSTYHLARFFELAIKVKGIKGIAFIAERENSNLRLNIWDMRSSEVLSARWSLFKRCIFCSGTLEPIEAFADIIGIDSYMKISVPNFYSREKVKVYLLKGVSTRGETLSEEMVRRYTRSIVSFLKIVKSNSAIFTASYRVQEELLKGGLEELVMNMGYKVFKEEKSMSGQKSKRTLEEFKKTADEGKAVLIAPMGGRFAEGADFPGKELQAIFLVGIPFEKPSVKVKLYIKYYSELYGSKGREYAYIIPALKRAAQALGRAIRGPNDSAVLILGDERYRKYMRFLPEYIKEWYVNINYGMIEKIDVPWICKPV